MKWGEEMGNAVAKWIKEDKDKWFNGYSCTMLKVFGELQEYDYIEYDNLDLKKYEGFFDVFCTQNTFKSKKRTKDNVLQLRMLWQDLDNVKDIPLTIKKIDKLVKDGIIPEYNYIIDSGTGLHIKWVLKDYSGSKRNLQAWDKLQKYLYKKLKHLGADRGALDVSRVLRVEGSINSKNNKVVKKIATKKVSDNDLWELYNKYIYTLYKEKKQTKKANKKSKLRLITNSYNLNKTRLLDLKKILELRNYKLDGVRNKFLMLYGTYYILSGATPNEAICKLNELNKKIKSKKKGSNSEIKTIIRNGIKRAKASLQEIPKLLPKNSTIIEMLNITLEEQKYLKTIISKEVKYIRKNEHKKENRRNKNGLTNREQKKRDLIEEVRKLSEEGYKQVEIAKKLNITKGRVSQINKELKIADTMNKKEEKLKVKVADTMNKKEEKLKVKVADTMDKKFKANYNYNQIELAEKLNRDMQLKKFNEMAP